MLLIDRKMPESCDDCFCNDDYYRCGLMNKGFEYPLEGRMDGCPLRESDTSEQPEIIRCKDCKYGSPNEVYGCRLEPFSTHDRDSRMYADDFCSRAERRADDER